MMGNRLRDILRDVAVDHILRPIVPDTISSLQVGVAGAYLANSYSTGCRLLTKLPKKLVVHVILITAHISASDNLSRPFRKNGESQGE